jgi:uncharacterized membrane protein YqhA
MADERINSQLMKTFFNLLHKVIFFISMIVFAAGLVITILSTYEFFHVFSLLNSGESDSKILNGMAIGLLKVLDVFLFSIVFFVFSFGILVLFNRQENVLPENLPKWLRIEDFIQLKAILWEAVLTTLVISFLANYVARNFAGLEQGLDSLILPAAILMISISLHILKRH